MFVDRRIWTSLLLITLLLLTSTPFVSAQGDSQIFMPLVSGNSAPEVQAQTAGLGAQKTPQSNVYIVVMAADPIIAYEGEVEGLAATKPAKGSKVNPNSDLVKNYQKHLKQSHDNALAAVGVGTENKVYDYTFALNGFAAQMTPDEAKAMATQPNVVAVLRDQFRYPATDNSPSFLGLNVAGGPWNKNIKGENVVVGIIDTGIWPEHPSFADNGKYKPLPIGPLACNFGNVAHNPADTPFTCNNKLLGAYQFLETYKLVFGGLTPGEFDSARDDDGHGTHTASTAAGNANVDASIFGISRGKISGIAPRARIVAYKGLGEQGGFTSDLSAAIDRAVADGVDVINYSIGGGASLIGGDDISFLFAADAGVFSAVSAGNSGPGAATIGGPASVPWVTAVGASFQSRAFISDITLSGPDSPPTGVWGGSITEGITNYNLVDTAAITDTVAGRQCLNPFPPGTFQPNDAVLCNDYNFGVARTTRVANVMAGGGGAVLLHNVASVNVTPTDNHPLPTVHLLHDVGQPLKDYIAAHPGQVTISFTAGTTRYAPADPRVTPNVMTSFSSRGPNPVALDIIKPDVTAPGYQILAGASPIHSNTAAQGQLFQSIMGTSMSGPHVAGIFALIKEAHPEWSAAMAKSALMTTSYQDVKKQDFVSPADPFDMGAGHVNPGGKANKGSLFQPGLVYDAGLLEYFGFLCGTAPAIFANPEATCAFLESINVPTEPSDLNLASIGVADLAGTQTVTRKVTSVVQDGNWHDFVVSVTPPPGYTVTVNPSTLRLRRGDVATYQVTISNDGSAPIGEWRFGSLTWTNPKGVYNVYSPIAVRGALFDAPAEIDATGESGSASIPVKFGYTGDYEAKAHGLVAATVTSDNVVQDPDQDFDPNDGFSNAHVFNLADVAHFRIAMPPDATEAEADLDIYVFDPDGDLVAASTNGATDELVDISEPADGAWTVFVHGWATPGGDSDYDMYTWAIPSASGGSLVIDSAPTSATIATGGTVEVSWTGATNGQWHMGAVSHNRGTDLLGLTLLDIDNR